MSTHPSFTKAREEFEQACSNPHHTLIESAPVDVNAMFQPASEQVHLTKAMLWDAEVKKAWDPMTYIPGVVREGSSWGRQSLENGEECFLRESQQRAWRTDGYGEVLEEVYLSPKEQTVLFFGRAELLRDDGSALLESSLNYIVLYDAKIMPENLAHGAWSRLTSMRPRLLALFLAAMSLIAAEEIFEGRRSVVLQGEEARLVIDILGGSIVAFELNEQGLNPLRWANDGPTDQPRQMSHFLCLDRWGPPSDAEKANGMPFHGEAGHVEWQLLDQDPTTAQMRASLPLAGLEIERTVWLAPEGSWFQVRETVTNVNKLGRVYNMVQHATIGPPFLDEGVLVDSNATRGFPRGGAMPNPEQPSALWPQAPRPDGTMANVRRLTNDSTPDVVSYAVDEAVGWVTAANPAKGLLIGYVWQTEQYPWLNIWRRLDNGVPTARGIEFGTTGLHEPYPTLVQKGAIFDRPIYRYIDAAEGQTRSYVGFLAEIPEGYQGVDNLVDENGTLTLIERGGGSQIRLAVPAM